jgi:capsular exopolysaccharide synthesis family protein
MDVQTTPSGGYPGTHQHSAAPTHIWDYWAVVMKRIGYVALFIGASVGAAEFITQKQQKQYRATATIEILPPSVIRGADPSLMPVMVSDEKYLATQLQILMQADTVVAAVTNKNLKDDPAFLNKSPLQIAQMAIGRIDCTPRRGLYLVDVSVTGPEPKTLDKLANALVEAFKQMQKSESKKMRDERKAHLDERISIAESGAHLARLDKANALQGAQFSETTFESEWTKIQASRERFVQKRDELYYEMLDKEPVVKAFRQAQQDPKKGLDSIAQHPDMLLNPTLVAMDAKIKDYKNEKEKLLREGLAKNHERVVVIDEMIEQATKDRARAIGDEVNKYLLEYSRMEAKRDQLNQQVDRLTLDMTAAAAVKAKVDLCNDEIAAHDEARKAAGRELDAMKQSDADEKDAVVIVAPAKEPESPYSPAAGTNLTLGLVLGVVGGIALAFLLDYLDDTIRTKDELAKIAPDVPLLGVVPNIEARKSDVAKKDLFAANQPKSTIAEAYRGVRTALTLSARGPQQKVMLLTSAGPREGKTTTALNLATVLAFAGARTLIIDADLRKPRVHASFNLPNKKGLTNLIVGEEDPAEYCQRTDLERVDVLSSGPIPPNPSELLGRPRMREILRKLRERYDQIIIDTPPIGAVTDAAVIATMVDGVVLVVHAGKTRRQIVGRGLEQLRYINAPIIGVILNNLKLGRGRYYPGYYHYYYYYTSHYAAEDGESNKSKASKKGAAAPVDGDSAAR